ncbi:MAG: cytochrome c oxidase subunit 3 family protein [Deltaproteobacteria bacterium]|nr:cytochrome c oxidase subunit 3 family protein [Deltaproteobacteria bacterium]
MAETQVLAKQKQQHHHAHHFMSAEAEFEASKQGMWVFLVTEVLMFGGLFTAYAVFRGLYPDMFYEAHKFLNVKLGCLNTVILITSSLTMVLAVSASQRGEKNKTAWFLACTLILAAGFLTVKYIEYSAKFHHGLLPAGFFHNETIKHVKAPLFFSLYFIMTGLHGLHVLIGMGLILWIFTRALKGQFSSGYYTPVELVGFYWHFVDLVWIYLFPLLYLVG